jgi:hypothetical protein
MDEVLICDVIDSQTQRRRRNVHRMATAEDGYGQAEGFVRGY